jgi:hypothetical protein
MAKIENKNKLSDDEILDNMRLLAEQVKNNVTSQQHMLFDANGLGDEDLDTTYEDIAPNITANPDESHRLYYTMMMTMRSNLPKADNRRPITLERKKANDQIKKFNEAIYSEKKLFLNRGKEVDKNGIRGSDERQGYIPEFLQVAFDVVHKWVSTGANPLDLFIAFYELNKERGYRKDANTEKKTTDSNGLTFGNLLGAVANAGKPPKED